LILLSGMAAFAYRKIGPAATSGLAAEAVVIGTLAVVAFL
jgi:hypothetical protein